MIKVLLWSEIKLQGGIMMQITSLPISPVSKMSIHMGQSLFLIDHSLCVESDVHHFQTTFCAYAMFLNEIPDIECVEDAFFSILQSVLNT